VTGLGQRVAAVTGGGSGIGRAVVDALLEQGASVGVLERDAGKAEALRRLDAGIVVVQDDARSAAANDQLAGQLLERWGRIDVAMTFVGIFDLYTRLEDLPKDQVEPAFDEIFSVNVKSVLLTARAVTPALRASRGSFVVTLSSSSFYPGRGGILYVASKFALRGVVLQLAHELAPDVRVNGVAPGGTLDTDLRGPSVLDLQDERLDDRPGRREELVRRTPLRMALTGADHVGAYLYLASGMARGLTGEIIRSDGGLGVR
jgi:phthalate 3,4-cis-dihydrodiol dehydrogenase